MLTDAHKHLPDDELFRLINESLFQAKYRQAEVLCEELLTRPEFEAIALTMLAQTAYHLGKDDFAEGYVARAIDLCEEKLKLQPNNITARQIISTLLLSTDRGEEASNHVNLADMSLAPHSGPQAEFFERFESGIERQIPSSLIVGAPYSGSEELAKSLAEGLSIAQGMLHIGVFPRSALLPSRLAVAAQGGITANAQIEPSLHNIKAMDACGMRKLVLSLRDPRAVTAFWAHGVLFEPSLRVVTPLNRSVYPPAKIVRQGRSGVLDWSIEAFLPHVCGYISSWKAAEAQAKGQIDIHWHNADDAARDPQAEMFKVLDHFGIDRNEFDSNRAKASLAAPNSDNAAWRRVYTPDQLRRANELMPNELSQAFGWES